METFLLALPAPTDEKPDGSGWGGLGGMLPFLLLVVVMMLLMPLFSKKERTRQKRLQGLKKHDRVVTSGGMYGTVISFGDQTATLEVAKGFRVVFKRSSIYDIEREAEGGPPQETPEKQVAAILPQKNAQIAKTTSEAAAKQEELARQLSQVSTLLESEKERRTKLEKDVSSTYERPDGEVTLVNSRANTVWIDLGSTASVDRQMIFSVIDQNETGVTKSKVKGRIEITRVMDQHSSEARVLEEKTSNPELYGRLRVDDVEKPEAAGVRLDLTAGQTSTGVIVGANGVGGGERAYVRLANCQCQYQVRGSRCQVPSVREEVRCIKDLQGEIGR